MKKVVLKLDLHDDKAKQKAMQAVSRLSGIDSISIEMKEKKLVVIGNVDPVDVVRKLRKLWRTEIIAVGPAKEEKKDDKKEKEKEKEKEKKKGENSHEQIQKFSDAYKAYNPYFTTTHYYVPSAEENPNACVIC